MGSGGPGWGVTGAPGRFRPCEIQRSEASVSDFSDPRVRPEGRELEQFSGVREQGNRYENYHHDDYVDNDESINSSDDD